MNIYYINLDRSEDRREKMEKSFEHEKLIRISAIDGMEWAIEDTFDNRGFLVWNLEYRDKFVNEGILLENSILPPTHVACNLSHRKAIQEFLNTDDEWAIIMEDDVERSKVYLKDGELIEKKVVIPSDADMFYLCGTRPDRRIYVFDDGQVRKTRTLMGYCISRRGAELFLKSTIPMMWLSDYQFPVCCFDSMSNNIRENKIRDRRIVFKKRTLFKENKDDKGNITRKKKECVSFSIPSRDKYRIIKSILPNEIESEEKIKAFADKKNGLIKHSILSKQSLLGHYKGHGKRFH
jgi:GR25 family glycosyltransferase involved in LPS biosynthesis